MTAPVRMCLLCQPESKALSQRMGYNFHSLVKTASGKVLAANEDGLFLLGGSTDNGSAVSAYFAFTVDFQLDVRINALWVHFISTGNLNFTLEFDDRTSDANTYLLEPLYTNKWHSMRVDASKLEDWGRQMQLKVANVSGSWFAISSITADVLPVGRRVMS